MCGILGTAPAVEKSNFLSALQLISHRGPDDSGTYFDDDVCLGHQRLSILDLTANGHQPMSDPSEQVWIVFNGEIYNHLEIREALGNTYQFRSTSDTETILNAYLKYGKDVVNHLNGIFAFGIYDKRSNELFVARDPLGVKPLYYFAANNRVAFASEMKSLVPLTDVDLSLNPTAFQDYLHFLWSPGSATPFKHIKKLEPGCYFCKKLNEDNPPVFTKYYELPFRGEYSQKSENALVNELDERLNTAVRRQLLSDVPIGFFLSGGLDSSLIAAIARKQLGTDFRCYTIHIPGKDTMDGFGDDLNYARKVAKHLDVRLVEVLSDSDIVRDFDKMVWHLDEPQADPAPLHVLNICESARANGDVVLLGGTAGDDLFSGYRRHQALNYEPWLRACPRFLGPIIERTISLFGTRSPRMRRLRKFSKGLSLDSMSRMTSYYEWLDLDRNRSLFRPKVIDLFRFRNPSKTLTDSLQNIPDEKQPLNQMLYWDIKYFLADHNLNYTDKMSMACGVEVRVPFLDLELVEFACKLPVQVKMKGTQAKYLLKIVAERYLPKDVIYRPKTGFGAPLRRWISEGRFQGLIDRLLNSENSLFDSIFSREEVGKLISDTISGQYDGSYAIWSLLAIDSWLRQFATHEKNVVCKNDKAIPITPSVGHSFI